MILLDEQGLSEGGPDSYTGPPPTKFATSDKDVPCLKDKKKKNEMKIFCDDKTGKLFQVLPPKFI